MCPDRTKQANRRTPCRSQRSLVGAGSPSFYKHGAPDGAVFRQARPALLGELFFLQRPEDVTLIVRHLILLEERQVFLAKGFAHMVPYLVPDVVNHPG